MMGVWSASKLGFGIMVLAQLLALFTQILIASPLLEDHSITLNSSKPSEAEARQDIFSRAVKQAAQETIDELIGRKMRNANNDLIEARVIKEAGRFVPSLKGGALTKTGSTYTMTVDLKVSIDDLQTLLRQNGLLYGNQTQPTVLHFLAYHNEVDAAHHSWWSGKGGMRGRSDKNQPSESLGSVGQIMTDWENALQTALLKQGFFAFRPWGFDFAGLMPLGFAGVNLKTEDVLRMCRYLGADVGLTGDIRIQLLEGKPMITVNVKGLQASNGRVIAEVVRKYAVNPDAQSALVAAHRKALEVVGQIGNDLSDQLAESWRRGTFGSESLDLVLLGQFSYQDLEKIKSMLGQSGRTIKSVRERRMNPQSVVLAIDAAGGALELAAAVRKLESKEFRFNVGEVRNQSLDVQVMVVR